MAQTQVLPLIYKIDGERQGDNSYIINGYYNNELVMVYKGFIGRGYGDSMLLYPKRRLSYNPRLPDKHRISFSRDVRGWEKKA